MGKFKDWVIHRLGGGTMAEFDEELKKREAAEVSLRVAMRAEHAEKVRQLDNEIAGAWSMMTVRVSVKPPTNILRAVRDETDSTVLHHHLYVGHRADAGRD